MVPAPPCIPAPAKFAPGWLVASLLDFVDNHNAMANENSAFSAQERLRLISQLADAVSTAVSRDEARARVARLFQCCTELTPGDLVVGGETPQPRSRIDALFATWRQCCDAFARQNRGEGNESDAELAEGVEYFSEDARNATTVSGWLGVSSEKLAEIEDDIEASIQCRQRDRDEARDALECDAARIGAALRTVMGACAQETQAEPSQTQSIRDAVDEESSVSRLVRSARIVANARAGRRLDYESRARPEPVTMTEEDVARGMVVPWLVGDKHGDVRRLAMLVWVMRRAQPSGTNPKTAENIAGELARHVWRSRELA